MEKKKTALKNRSKKLEYGFIYPLFSFFVQLLFLFNLVEWFKKIACLCVRIIGLNANERIVKSITIDIFIVSKFVFVILMFLVSKRMILTYFIIYLMLMNIFTYFYYHVWEHKLNTNIHHLRRCFVSLCIAIGFNVLCYTYLFHKGFVDYILWSNNTKVTLSEIVLFSISNTFMLSTQFSVINKFGHYLQISQQLVSFVFLVIILSQSIPTTNHQDKEKVYLE